MSIEYGRKAYSSSDRYPEWIQTRQGKWVWDRITEAFPRLADGNVDYRALTTFENAAIRYVKQSEFKKPYGNSYDYQRMEQEWEGLPGYTPGNNKSDIPTNFPTWDPGDELSPSLCFIDAELDEDDCYCIESWMPITITGTHSIIDLEVHLGEHADTDLRNITGFGTRTVNAEVYAGSGTGYYLKLDATIDCGKDFNYSQGVATVKLTNCDSCPEWYITLTRGDGTTITASYLDGFYAKGKTSGIYHALDYEYEGAGEWHVWLTGANGYDTGDPPQYYLSYKTKFADAYNYWSYTQYPSKYQDSEKEQSADATGYGTLSDTTAYFEVTSAWATTPVAWASWPTYYTAGSGNEFYPCAGMSANNFICVTYVEAGDPIGTWRAHKTGQEIRWEAEVSSNVDYSVRMYTTGTTGRRITARGIQDADMFECFLDSDCSNYFDYDTTYGNCICDFNGIDNSGTSCTEIEEYFTESVSVVETASDGLDADTYGPGTASSPVYTFAAYDDTVNITSPDVNGKTHYFEYSIEADDIDFEWEDDDCSFGGDPNCGDGAAPSTCCTYYCNYFWGGIDNTAAAYYTAMNLQLALIDLTLATPP